MKCNHGKEFLYTDYELGSGAEVVTYCWICREERQIDKHNEAIQQCRRNIAEHKKRVREIPRVSVESQRKCIRDRMEMLQQELEDLAIEYNELRDSD